MSYTLRGHQPQLYADIVQAVADGHKRILVSSPTGSGKTITALDIINKSIAKGKRSIFVCDRTSLIDQTCEKAELSGIEKYGVIQANHYKFRPGFPFQIASVQTLMRRNWPENLDLAIIDEAHVTYKTWVDFVMGFNGVTIGLSATPFNPKLGHIFTKLVSAGSMHDMVEAGNLVPFETYFGVAPDMRGVKRVAGEIREIDAEERGMAIIGDVAGEWMRLSPGQKTIAFGPTVKYCHALQEQFAKLGVSSAVYVGETKGKDRRQMDDDFRNGDLTVLISCEALAKGHDAPCIRTVIDGRPFSKSFSSVVQMIGRGARIDKGKTKFRIHDHSGNMMRFLESWEDFYFNGVNDFARVRYDEHERPEPERREAQEQKSCPNCGHKPFFSHCIACGHTTPVREKEQVETREGRLERMADLKRKSMECKAYWDQICAYFHGKENAAKRAAGIYKDINGKWPPWRYNDQARECSQQVRGKITSMFIRRAHRRA